MKRISVAIAAVMLTGIAAAAAQPAPAASKPAPKTKVINISDPDEITGDRPTGELMPIGVREAASSGSLLRIRQDFIDLILKAAEQV